MQITKITHPNNPYAPRQDKEVPAQVTNRAALFEAINAQRLVAKEYGIRDADFMKDLFHVQETIANEILKEWGMQK